MKRQKCNLCENGIITKKNSFEPCPVCRAKGIKEQIKFRYGKSIYKHPCSKGSQELKIRLDKKHLCKPI